MSYRIYIGIVKLKDLNKQLSVKFTDSDEDYDKKWDFFYNTRDTELNDGTDIGQFKIVKGYEDEEYAPYILTKKDFQKILDYYKHFLKEYFEKKENDLKCKPANIEQHKFSNISIHFYYLANYFKRLIIQNKNIDTDGLFLLDYFYLVQMYNNWKNGDRAIITHG